MSSENHVQCELDGQNESPGQKLQKKYKVVSYMEGKKLSFLIICDYMMTMDDHNSLYFKWPDRKLNKRELEEIYENDNMNTEDWLNHRIIEVHHARRKLKKAQRDRQKLDDMSRTKKGIDDVQFTTTDDDDFNPKNRRGRKRLADFIYDDTRKKLNPANCAGPSTKIQQSKELLAFPSKNRSPEAPSSSSIGQCSIETPRGYRLTHHTPRNNSSALEPKRHRIRSLGQLSKQIDDFENNDPEGDGLLTASEFRTCMRGLVYCLKHIESQSSNNFGSPNSGIGNRDFILEDVEPPALIKSWPLACLTSFVNQEEELKDKNIRKSVVTYLSNRIHSPYYDRKFGEMTTRLLNGIFAACLQTVFVFSAKTRYRHKMVKFETTRTNQLIKEVVLQAHNMENEKTLVDPDDVQNKMKFWWNHKTDNIKKWYSSKYNVTGDTLKIRVSNYIEEQREKITDEIGDDWATYFD